jgi:hypothetical protein
MPSFQYACHAQLRLLVTGLNPKTYSAHSASIKEVSTCLSALRGRERPHSLVFTLRFGCLILPLCSVQLVQAGSEDARLHLMCVLLDEIDFAGACEPSLGPSGSTAHKDHYKLRLLSSELMELSARPNFTSILCRALEVSGTLLSLSTLFRPLTYIALLPCKQSKPVSDEFFGHFTRALRLSFSQQILIALALTHSVLPKAQEQGLPPAAPVLYRRSFSRSV